MFDYPRNRRCRQVKTLLKLLIIATFFWWLIVFGFKQDKNEDNKFGEHLDRNQIEKSQMRKRGGFRNFYKSQKDKDYKYMIGENNKESVEMYNELKIQMTTKFSHHEESILKDFMNSKIGVKNITKEIHPLKPPFKKSKHSKKIPEKSHHHKKSHDNHTEHSIDKTTHHEGIKELILKEIERVAKLKKKYNETKLLNPSDAKRAQLINPMDTEKVNQLKELKEKIIHDHKVEDKKIHTKNSTDDELKLPKKSVKVEAHDEKTKQHEKLKIQNVTKDEVHNEKPEQIDNAAEDNQDIPPPEVEIDQEVIPYGDYGKAVTLPSDIPQNIKKLVEDGWKNHEFNEYVSNLIPLQRNLHDFRSDYCRDIHKNYSKKLPSVSVIIVFYNEAWSTLLRSIYSVINRTPSNVLAEIILVDDFSYFEYLKQPLDDFVKNNTKIRLFRSKKREGLIHARNLGASLAKGEILVFLDSHIECTIGWIEPLIDRIARNKTSIAVPVIERIHDNTFELQPRERKNFVSLGGFSWNLQFKWFYRKTSDIEHPHDPVKSPTMAGGLFAISSKFFKHMGMYDNGLDIWGGENLELSFKTWMCGGRIEIVQCSHVGHVFRKKSPYEWRTGVDVLRKNVLRVSKVWMDDYIVFYKYATGFHKTDYGDISERVKLRKDLKCKDFDWYLKNVYPERTIPSEGIAYGEIKNLGYNGKMCLDGKAAKDSPSLRVSKCDGMGGTQFWEYNGEILRDNYCVTYDAHNLMTQHCKQSSKQMFTYDPEYKQIYIAHNDKCLTMTSDFSLVMERCNKNSEGQRWSLENLEKSRIKVEKIHLENKSLQARVTFKIIEAIKNEIFTIKPPRNIFNKTVGELGEAVYLPNNYSNEIKKLIDDGWKNHQFNEYISDVISINRSLSDLRTDYCKSVYGNYSKSLPKSSIIITFHNEAWSTLLRTVHSILNRSPEYLIEEIILVDDFSNMDHLREPLNRYMRKHSKVKIIRCDERVGLIKARMIGAKSATAQILTFLDSHVECAEGWLEPMLERIAQNSSNVVCPVIDTIDDKTFEYQWITDPNYIPLGGFDWKMAFKWIINFNKRDNPSLPIKTPTMAGGLFSIDKAFFERLGMYDPDFDIWGGENLELSFKTWMCGGTLEIIPCSHVGHIFRAKSPYKWRTGVNVIKRNSIRLAEVWLDDYAKFFYMRIHARQEDFTDVASRRMLRKNLQCKNFKWYLEQVYPTQFDPSQTLAQGKLKNIKYGKCIEINPQRVELKDCHHKSDQFIILSKNNELKRDDYCLSVKHSKMNSDFCFNSMKYEQVWSYNDTTNQIFHNHTHKCLVIGIENVLTLEKCNETFAEQKWLFDYIKNVHY